MKVSMEIKSPVDPDVVISINLKQSEANEIIKMSFYNKSIPNIMKTSLDGAVVNYASLMGTLLKAIHNTEIK